MKKISIEDIVVVIRSCGENTEKVCHDLVCREIDKKNVHIINENPFEKALLKSYEIGIKSKKKVLITIDADVLIKRNAIKDLLEYSYLFQKNVFIYEGMLYDALLLTYRPGGVKVYNKEYLSIAKDYIPKIGTELRPETYIHRKMESIGKRREVVPIKVGLHDYEQNINDLIRKISYHRIKHSHRTKKVAKKWEKLSHNNKYYKK